MATQPCPGIAQVDVIMSDDAQNVQNGFHVYRGTDTLWSLDDLILLAGVFHEWWQTHLIPLLPPTTALVEVKVTDLTSLAGRIFQEAADESDVGTNASGAPLPNNVTTAVKFNVSERGRGVAGRIFWPQMVSNQVADGSFLTLAFETAVLTALDALRAQIAASIAGAELCVLSRTLNKVKRAAGIPKVVQSFSFADNSVDSQKDRLPNHKKHKKQA